MVFMAFLSKPRHVKLKFYWNSIYLDDMATLKSEVTKTWEPIHKFIQNSPKYKIIGFSDQCKGSIQSITTLDIKFYGSPITKMRTKEPLTITRVPLSWNITKWHYIKRNIQKINLRRTENSKYCQRFE